MNSDLVILYVEDDPESREVMQLLVEEVMQMPHLMIFPDSIDFMNRITALEPQPDAILLDIHMQPYDGFQMLKMLRNHSDFRDQPVIALTASVMNEELQQLQEAGFDGVIPKPIDLDTFPMRLEQLIKSKNLQYEINYEGDQ